jgi:hypothetical protein
MDGVLTLRDVAEAIRDPETCGRRCLDTNGHVAPSPNNFPEVRLCAAGFVKGAARDLREICEFYGMSDRLSFDEMDRSATTHVVIPQSRLDLGENPGVAINSVSKSCVSMAIDMGVPVVTIDFFFDLIDELRRFKEFLQQCTQEHVIACPSADARSIDRLFQGSVNTQAKEVEHSTPQNSVSSQTRVDRHVNNPETNEILDQIEGVDKGMDKEIHYRENLDANICCTPCTTPGDAEASHVDLKNFAAICSVTPLEDNYGDDDSWTDCASNCRNISTESTRRDITAIHLEMKTLALDDIRSTSSPPVIPGEENNTILEEEENNTILEEEENNTILEEENIIPGNLLLRAPRNNKVRQRHSLPQSSRNLIEFTYSMTLRLECSNTGVDLLDIDTKNRKNVALQCGSTIIKPLFFYKIRGEYWRMEFRKFFRLKNVPLTCLDLDQQCATDDAELFLSTETDACTLNSLNRSIRRIFVDKLPTSSSRKPILAMKISGYNDPAHFWRFWYNPHRKKIQYTNQQ